MQAHLMPPGWVDYWQQQLALPFLSDNEHEDQEAGAAGAGRTAFVGPAEGGLKTLVVEPGRPGCLGEGYTCQGVQEGYSPVHVPVNTTFVNRLPSFTNLFQFVIYHRAY